MNVAWHSSQVVSVRCRQRRSAFKHRQVAHDRDGSDLATTRCLGRFLSPRSRRPGGGRPHLGGSLATRIQDSRQLEGELIVLTGRYEVGGVVFDPWEIEELEDLT
jgi:hypothetical protein